MCQDDKPHSTFYCVACVSGYYESIWGHKFRTYAFTCATKRAWIVYSTKSDANERQTKKNNALDCFFCFFLFFLSFMNESNFFLFSCDAVVQSNSAACTSFCFPLFLCFIFTFLLVFVCGMCISSLDRCFFCVFRLVFLSRCSHRWPCSAATIVDMLVRLQFYHTIYVPMYPTINYTIHQNTQIYIV